jgi:hypothetical protein
MRLPHRQPVRRPTVLAVEELEPRRAPAVLVNAHTVTYTDVDGDRVTVKTSQGTFSLSQFTFAASGLGEQLQEIDLHNQPAFAGANITITAKRTADGGDGFVNVGAIFARDFGAGVGIDLGAVTVRGDLGRITAGDSTTATPALKALTVQSLGRFGTSTQAPGGSLESDILGALGSLRVNGDVDTAFVNVQGAVDGKINKVLVGGSLIGGAATSSGEIAAIGGMGLVTVLGNLQGGAGNFSGEISANGQLAGATIGGSLIGAGGMDSGSLDANGDSGPVTVRGDVRGGAGDFSGSVEANGKLAGATIGGSLIGGGGNFSGEVDVNGDSGRVAVGGDVRGGAGDFSGDIDANGKLAGVTIGGSLLGSEVGSSTGSIDANGDLGPVTIAGEVRGNSGNSSAKISANGKLARVTIGGSLLGGNGNQSGTIIATGNVGRVTIGGDVRGGSVSGSDSLDESGFLQGQRLAKVVIGGSVIAGSNTGSGTLTDSGAIRAADDIGSLTVGGSLIGNTTNLAIITARGQATPTPGSDVAIGRLTVGGRVELALILAGYDTSTTPAFGKGVNADAQIGSIHVGGDWVASSVAAGVRPGVHGFGNGDAKLSGAGVTDDPGTISLIGRIVIDGEALGTVGGADEYGFVAEQVGSLSVGGTLIGLTPGPHNDHSVPVGATGDLHVGEV